MAKRSRVRTSKPPHQRSPRKWITFRSTFTTSSPDSESNSFRGSETNVTDFVARQLVEAADPWQLAHYRTRLTSYYPNDNDANLVTSILDVLSLTQDSIESLSVDEILDAVTTREAGIARRNELLRLLRLMDADHYLSRDTEGKYRFRFALIRRWWKLDRGL